MMQALGDMLGAAFGALAEGAATPGSAWRHVSLGTVAADGQPRIRTLVLRAFDAGARTLDLHTDRRSAKFAELQASPLACVHVWNAASGEQLRLEGNIAMHAGDAVAQGAWSLLRPASQNTYRAMPGPGCVIDEPGESLPALDDAAAFACFVVLRFSIKQLEYLLIRESVHRRARFTWESGLLTPIWLAP
jgi:hypothetical protein